VVIAGALCGCGRLGFGNFDTANGAGDGGATGDGTLGDDGGAGAWTVFSPAPGITNTLDTVVGFAANDVWVGGVGPVAYHFDGTSWVASTGPVKDVYMLWGQSPTDVWEVGLLCDVNRWNGTAWMPSVPTGCMNQAYYAVGGVAVTDLWLAGVGGGLSHLVGTTWSSLPQGGNIDLWSVWVASVNDIYFVGTKGTIRHWTGTMADESIAPNQTLTSVWGSSSNDVWAVGAGALVYHKVNGGAWNQVTVPTNQYLYAVWGTAANDIWAVGDNATVLHYDGSQWSSVTVPGVAATTSLRGIAGIPGAGVRIVGTSGTVLVHP
jgi:hypothetical protein